MDGKHRVIGRCPVCGEPLHISELQCSKCGISIRGDFKMSPFLRLSQDEEVLLLTFIKHIGNLSEVSKELSISYPTLRNRLENIVSKLGLRKPEESGVMEILDMVERGEMSVEKAIKILKKGGKNE